MITWLQLWPLLVFPSFLISALSALPTVLFNGRYLGGGPIREWLLNHVLLSWLPQTASIDVVAWWAHALPWQEWCVTLLLAFNLNVLLLPLLFGFGEIQIRFRNWTAATTLELKRKGVRR